MMVSILHKAVESKVEKAPAHEKLDVITNKSEFPAHESTILHHSRRSVTVVINKYSRSFKNKGEGRGHKR